VGLLDVFKGKGSSPVSFVREGGEAALGLAWVGGGNALAIGRGDGSVEVLDGKTGETKRSELLHEDGLLTMAADPLGALVLTGGADGKAILLDATSFERIKTIDTSPETKGAWIEHVAFAPDGNRVAIAAGKLVWLGQIRGGSELIKLGPHASTVGGLSFRADGGAVAVARYGGVDLWTTDAEHRELLWKSSIISVAWQPQGRFLAAGCQDEAVHFWRLDGSTDSMMGGYPSKPRAICWSQDGDQLATGGGFELVIWSFKGKGPEGTTPLILKGHEGLITTIARAPKDQRIASGGRDGKLLLWRPGRSEKPVLSLDLGDVVQSIAFSPDGRIAAGAANGTVVVATLP
jgi:WD40 repeat protein